MGARGRHRVGASPGTPVPPDRRAREALRQPKRLSFRFTCAAEGRKPLHVKETAIRVFVTTLVAVAVVVAALALWKLRILIALLFLTFIFFFKQKTAYEIFT